MKNAALKIAFAVWIGLWLLFVARELLVKNNLRDYKSLMTRSLDEKHAYVTGEDFYRFLMFCKANLPSGATYSLMGIEEGSIDRPRAVYYLYPFLEKSEADFVLSYGNRAPEMDGHMIFAGISGSGYIMKKVKAR